MSFVMWVGAEGENGGEASNGGCVGCARATHDYGKNVDFSTRSVLANGIDEGGIFVVNHVCGVGEVVAIAIFPFLYQNLFDRGAPSVSVRVADDLGSRSRMKSGLCAGGLNSEGNISPVRIAGHEVR
jgi:hypothetical protein